MILHKNNKLHKRVLTLLLIIVLVVDASQGVFAGNYNPAAESVPVSAEFSDPQEASDLPEDNTEHPDVPAPDETDEPPPVPEDESSITDDPAEDAAATSVYTESDLKTALADPGVTYILLENNITLNSTINQNYAITNTAARTEQKLTIDGQDRWSIIQNSTSAQRGIILNHNGNTGGSLNEIIIQNMDIVSQMNSGPFNGLVTTTAYAGYSALTISFLNVNFTGVRAVTAPGSMSVFKNCKFNLTGTTADSSFVYAKSVTFDGTVDITRDEIITPATLLKLQNGGRITVNPDAKVHITNNGITVNNTVAAYKSTPCFVSDNNLDMTVEEKAEFVYKSDTQASLLQDENHSFNSVLVKEGAKFDVRALGPREYHFELLFVTTLKVEKDAEFYLVRGRVGTTLGPDKSALSLTQYGTATFDNPKNVFIYCYDKVAVKGFLNGSSINIKTAIIRHWNTTAPINNWEAVIAGGTALQPDLWGTHRWYNTDFTTMHFTANMYSPTWGTVQTSGASHNGTYTSPGNDANPFSQYNLNSNTKAVAFGQVYGLTYILNEEDISNGAAGQLPVDAGSPFYAMTTVTIASGDSLTMPNARFSHWADVTSEEKVEYYPDQNIQLDHSIVLEAVFKKVVVKVRFDADSELIPDPPPVYVILGGIYGDIVDANGDPLPDETFPTLDHTEPSEVFPKRFSHWQDDRGQSIDADTIVAPDSGDTTDEITVTAIWTDQAIIRIQYEGSFRTADPPVVIPDKLLFADKSPEASIDLEPYSYIEELADNNYEARFYTLNGETAEYSLTEHVSASQDQIVAIQYFSTIFHLDFSWNNDPLLFRSHEGDGGEIVSDVYNMTNRSELPVTVQLNMISSTQEDLDGLSFVQQAHNSGEFHLELLHSETDNNGFDQDIIDIPPDNSKLSENTLGTLGGTRKGLYPEGYFTIGGKYVGPLNFPALQPNVNFHFIFTFE